MSQKVQQDGLIFFGCMSETFDHSQVQPLVREVRGVARQASQLEFCYFLQQHHDAIVQHINMLMFIFFQTEPVHGFHPPH